MNFMRNIFFLFFALLIFFLAILSLVLMIKPGASIFFQKSPIIIKELNSIENIFEYIVQYEVDHFNLDSVLIVQDGKPLSYSTSDGIESLGAGSYMVVENYPTSLRLYFLPRNNLDPFQDSNHFQIYIRPSYINSNTGGAGFIIFFVLFSSSIYVYLRDKNNKWILMRPPKNFQRLLFLIFNEWRTLEPQHLPARSLQFFKGVIACVLSAYILCFLEWVFFITKSSFMDSINYLEKIRVFFISGFLLSLMGVFIVIILFILDFLISKKFPNYRIRVFFLPAAILLSGSTLLMVDNFTYTIFHYGIIDSKTIFRIVYAILFLICTLFFIHWIATKMATYEKLRFRYPVVFGPVFLVSVSMVLIIVSIQPASNKNIWYGSISQSSKKPNIILIGSDGVNAKNLSLYGYDRKTTPFLETLADSSLLSMNNFPNASHTLGSTISILTGKSSFSTRVFRYPDILQNSIGFENLPGILKDNGYKTITMGVPRYLDLANMNFHPSFDSSNCKDTVNIDFSRFFQVDGLDFSFFFIYQIFGRIIERVDHIFFLANMENISEQIQDNKLEWLGDREKFSCLYQYLDESAQTGQPIFAHLHLMGTHGGLFLPRNRTFSKGENQDDHWMTHFYDDAILNYDQEIASLVRYLISINQYQNTILVLYSDHGQKWTTTDQLPLLIHFPENEYSALLEENTQNMDIAPTILDYLNLF